MPMSNEELAAEFRALREAATDLRLAIAGLNGVVNGFQQWQAQYSEKHDAHEASIRRLGERIGNLEQYRSANEGTGAALSRWIPIVLSIGSAVAALLVMK